MKYAIPITRILLGLPFLVFGLNGFLMFIEPPAEMAPAAKAFLDALTEAKFMHPIRAFAEAVSGGLLVIGLWVPLALVILAPVLVHIVGYHLFLDDAPGALGFTSALILLFLFQSWLHRGNFGCLFRGLPKPKE